MPTQPQPTHFAPAGRYPEAEIIKQQETLHSQQYLSNIFDSVPDIVMVVNDRRQIVYANQALLDIAQNATPADLIGTRPGEVLGCINHNDGPDGCGTGRVCATCGIVGSILNTLNHSEKNSQECRFTTEDGQSLDFQVMASPIELEDQVYIVVSIQDISHEKRRRVLERIFLHDIMNSVSIVVSAAHLLDDIDEATMPIIKETLTHSATVLVDEIKAQQALLEAESGELLVNVQPINSRELLTAMAFFYQNHELTQERTLLVEPSSASITFSSDPVLLRRVLENMTKNALEACPEGQTVTLGCETVDDGVVFSVHNPAVMPQQVQMQVFQRSFSTKGAGRGLGTYSMRLLSERYLQGRVFFTSSAEQGTTFYARYPIQPVQPSDEQ